MSQQEFTNKTELWEIKGYKINPEVVPAQGDYGVIYQAVDSEGNKIAVKNKDIGGKHKLPNIIKDEEKLKHLNHPNIVKVYDIHQGESVVWIFMELCDYGHLNKFYRNSELTQDQLVEIMMELIEIFSLKTFLFPTIPHIQIKLTDFDVSSSLKEFLKPQL